jgi:hypothetical protein
VACRGIHGLSRFDHLFDQRYSTTAYSVDSQVIWPPAGRARAFPGIGVAGPLIIASSIIVASTARLKADHPGEATVGLVSARSS